MRLGLKLGLISVAVVLLLMAIVLASLYQTSVTQMERYDQLRTTEVRYVLTTAFADALVRKDTAEILDLTHRLLDSDTDITFVEVTDLGGRTLVRRGNPDTARPAPITADILIGGQSYGQVRFAVSNIHQQQGQQTLMRTILVNGVLVACLAVAIFLAIGHVLTSRLREVTRCADEIAAGNFYPSLPEGGADEVGHLSAAFSTMATTLKQRFEELSQAKMAAEAANRSKSMFLANMSHEFRTPLNGIIGLSEVAARQSSDVKQRNQLEKVVRAGHQLNEVVTDILEMSRLETGQLYVEKNAFTLSVILAEMASQFSAQASEKDLELRFDCAPDLVDQTLLGDAPRIGRILRNLIANALKFTAAGQVIVSMHCLDTWSDKVKVRFEVSDSGIGIVPDDLQRIFQAFEQADGSLSRAYGGVGLGLPISKGLVALLGGQLEVKSTPDQGSTFWFDLTLAKPLAA